VRITEARNAYKILVGKSKGRKDHWADLGIDGRIMLQWLLTKYYEGVNCRTGFI
jgi:hypothetical protein